MSLNFLNVFLFPWPRISRAYTCDISWNYGWKLCEKKEEEVMLDEKMGKVAKGKKIKNKKENKKIKKCSFMFLRLHKLSPSCTCIRLIIDCLICVEASLKLAFA